MAFSEDIHAKNATYRFAGTPHAALNIAVSNVQIQTVAGSGVPGAPSFYSVLADLCGCGHYRSKFITLEIFQFNQTAAFTESQHLPVTREELEKCNSIRLQRLHTLQDREYLLKFLLPMREKCHFKILFDLDDILVRDDIPDYNIYREIFRDADQVLPEFLVYSDVVTVSTPQLRDYYAARYNIAPERFHVLPNYVPQYWADHYHPAVVADKLARHCGQKIRIGFSSSPSHFDLDGRGKAGDDMSGIIPWIIANRKKYQFVFQGGISRALLPYKADLEIHPYVPFLHFLQERQKLDLDLLIQPLADNAFNRAKSEIKIYEAWATGIPILAQDLPNYLKLGADSCFHDERDLSSKIDALFASPEHYAQVAAQNYRQMETRWLHHHLREWYDLML